MPTEYNGSALVVARQMRCMTQAEASEKLGITQGKLSKAENGLQGLDPTAMRRASDLYGVPLSFFSYAFDGDHEGHLYFRKRNTANKLIDAFIAKTKVMKHNIDRLISEVELPTFSLPHYPAKDSSPEDIADKIRYELKVFGGPVRDLAVLLENCGVIISMFDFGNDLMDGHTSVTPNGRPVIFLNSRMPNDRVRFSLAHELGHLIMHIFSVPSLEQNVEKEANAFASEFLMPEAEIAQYLENLTFEKAFILKQRWRVSVKALIYRAETLGAIDERRQRNLFASYCKKGFNRGEPGIIPAECPKMLSMIFDLYKDELGYSSQELTDFLCIGQHDFAAFYPSNPQTVLNLRLQP